ncbi:MAG: recombinase family protein [Chloroflexi bacterium]|nr:recombinase family protein [Chloroflexota bacterium]
MKIDALYARVSGRRQEKEETVQSQLAELRQAVQADLGPGPVVEFVDEGYGRDTLERPALDRLRDRVSADEVGRIFVPAPDRLASGAKLIILYEEFTQKGVEVVFLTGAADDTPEGKLLLHMQGAFAEYERTKILERTRRGKLYWARQGFIVSGSPAYGFRMIKRTDSSRATLVLDDFEASVVREMYRLLLDDSLSTRAITVVLNARSIPTARGAAQWKPTTVNRILQNPANKGAFMYQRTRAVFPRKRINTDPYNNRKTGRISRPSEEHITIDVPAIVSEETWSAAQEQLIRNAKNARRNNKRYTYLLRGLIRCPGCGGTYSGAASMGVRRYRCTNKDAVVSGHDRKCMARSIRANAIEESVWDAISNTLQSPDLIESEYRLRLEAKGVSDGAEMEEQRLRSSTKSLERRKDRLTEAYLDEVLDLDRYGAEMKTIEAEVSELDRQLAAIESNRTSSAAEAESLQRVESFCSEVAQGLRTMDDDGKRRLMELLVERIDIEPEDKLKVHMVFPPDATTPGQSKAAIPTGELRHRYPEALEGHAKQQRRPVTRPR